MPQLLIAFSATIFGLLGFAHIMITFFGNRIHPEDAELIGRMKNSALTINPKTNVWRGWIGFNASHSLGMILFGSVYGYLSVATPNILFGSYFLLTTGLLMLVGFLVLAKRYWFNAPLIGIAISSIFYIAGIALGIS